MGSWQGAVCFGDHRVATGKERGQDSANGLLPPRALRGGRSPLGTVRAAPCFRRWRWTLLALALACGCAGAPAESSLRTRVEIADKGDAGETPGDALPPTDLQGFPTAPGLLPRDFEMKEEQGPLKGYVTKFYRVRSLAGNELIPLLNNWKSPKARILHVKQHNMLAITETPENMRILETVLGQLDVVPVQVEIEAKVIEILQTTGYEYGFELFVDRAPAGNTALRSYGGTFNSNSFLESLSNNAAPFQGATLNWASVGKVVEELGDFEFIMRALETEGYAEIISEPRIVCRTGQTATLKTSTELPVQEFILQSNNNPRITTRYKPVGVTLQVTPRVVGRDAIQVEVRPTVSNVVRFEFDPSGGGIPVPVIASRSAVTQVDIRNGELLVIGGLIDKQNRTDNRKVPIIGDIPLVGRLFQSEDDFQQKTQVVFILRIRILTSAEKARDRSRIPLTKEERIELEGRANDEDD
ncbi:MAG: type II secretion system protein GspD [Planctomycetota bacterium]|nr:MAG: type II secretion system protein GspD [Planctomycetota bacterium]